jgi:hypothetical protein
MEAKMEHMMKVGQEQLKKNAMQGVEGAMAAMNDPQVVAEMTKMLKDPSFAKQLKEMQNSPEFQQYVNAVRWICCNLFLGLKWVKSISLTKDDGNSLTLRSSFTDARNVARPRKESSIRSCK